MVASKPRMATTAYATQCRVYAALSRRHVEGGDFRCYFRFVLMFIFYFRFVLMFITPLSLPPPPPIYLQP